MRFGHQGWLSADVGSGLAEGYLLGGTLSLLLKGGHQLGKENRKILHSFALTNEFHRQNRWPCALSALGVTLCSLGVSIQWGARAARVVREGLKAMRVNQPACGHQPFLDLKAMAS